MTSVEAPAPLSVVSWAVRSELEARAPIGGLQGLLVGCEVAARVAASELRFAVEKARDAGWSWSEIAVCLDDDDPLGAAGWFTKLTPDQECFTWLCSTCATVIFDPGPEAAASGCEDHQPDCPRYREQLRLLAA